MHHHHHHDHNELSGRNLGISIVLNVVITVAQFIGGFISGSLSLLSDALHNFTDVVSLLISYFANKIAKKEATLAMTFGYKRAEILAAFINAASLVVIAILLIIEAIERFFNPQSIESNLVIALALLAILGNGFSVLLLKKSSKENMNMKSAYLHLLTDMLASIAVLLGGLVMKFYQLFWIDPVLTLAISVYLIYMAASLLKESTKVLMLFTPADVDVTDVVDSITEIETIDNVHHVHLWQLNEHEIHLEAHIAFKEDIRVSEFDKILAQIEHKVHHDFDIHHVNLQPEFNKCDDKNIIVQD